MSTPRKKSPGRARLLRELARAGREMSDAAVMFHTVLAAELELGPSDWKALGLLELHGPMTAGELSSRSGLAPASVTGMLDRLQKRGWIRRDRDAEDGRRVVVVLDPKAGERMVGSRFHDLTKRLEALYAGYSDQELALVRDALSGIARCQREATAELSGG